MAVNIAVYGAFVLIVAILGLFLWQTLFVSKEYSYREQKSEPAYSEQRSGDKQASRTSSTPSRSNTTDEAIAEYTKWLAIFTLFLVLATIGLFVSGERSVRISERASIAANRSAEAAKGAADIAKLALIKTQRAFVSMIGFETHVLNDFLLIFPKWENGGSTPTKRMSNYINWASFNGEPLQILTSRIWILKATQYPKELAFSVQCSWGQRWECSGKSIVFHLIGLLKQGMERQVS